MYVSMYSLMASDSSRKFSFYIFCESVDDNFERNLSHLHQNFDFEIFFIQMDNAPLAHYPLPGGLTTAIYYRLFVGSLLPKHLHRVLYVDCDTVVCRPISELFDHDLQDNTVGAIEEAEKFVGERLGVVPYFNSGVMLIDLDRWRNDDIESKTLHFLDHESQRVFCPDQDALNTALSGSWLQLPVRYNLHGSYCDKFKSESKNADPLIIHYCGSEKPWFYAADHPYKAHFQNFLQQTPYRDYQEPDRNLKNAVLKRMRRLRVLKNRYIKDPVKAFRRRYIKRPVMGAVAKVRNLF